MVSHGSHVRALVVLPLTHFPPPWRAGCASACCLWPYQPPHHRGHLEETLSATRSKTVSSVDAAALSQTFAGVFSHACTCRGRRQTRILFLGRFGALCTQLLVPHTLSGSCCGLLHLRDLRLATASALTVTGQLCVAHPCSVGRTSMPTPLGRCSVGFRPSVVHAWTLERCVSRCMVRRSLGDAFVVAR